VDRDTLVSTQITRRQVLTGGALAGMAAFIAACGTKGTASQAPAATEAPAATAATGTPAASEAAATPAASAAKPEATPSAELNWAQWAYYIDVAANDPAKHPSIDGFTSEYGTTVHYQEVIEENEGFVATIKDALKTGKDTGWDIITLTDWMAARLIRLAWVEEFNPANVPNLIANIKDIYRKVDWDPDVKHHAPWRSGMTSLGFDSKVVGDLTSLGALFTSDPKWNGKVEYLTEMRDAVGLSMLYLGLDPTKPTNADCDKAVALMQKAKADGVIRDVKGQSYTEDLKSGDAVVAMAWSGDMVQAQIDKASLKFALANEGGMLWTDNMMIPKGAAHRGTAELLINYFYDPEVSAMVSSAVDYISPVQGSDALVSAEKKNSPLINPPADWLKRLYIFGALTEAQEIYFNAQFAKVIGVG
jgi:spermidine/putrescine transport system substrate-binding protein